MKNEIFYKAHALKRDMEDIDRLFTVTRNSICDFRNVARQDNNNRIASIALRDLLFTEEDTLFKKDFLDFLQKEYDVHKEEFSRL